MSLLIKCIGEYFFGTETNWQFEREMAEGGRQFEREETKQDYFNELRSNKERYSLLGKAIPNSALLLGSLLAFIMENPAYLTIPATGEVLRYFIQENYGQPERTFPAIEARWRDEEVRRKESEGKVLRHMSAPYQNRNI